MCSGAQAVSSTSSGTLYAWAILLDQEVSSFSSHTRHAHSSLYPKFAVEIVDSVQLCRTLFEKYDVTAM